MSNLEEVRRRVAVVTGAGRGIGRATSLELARAGARVVLVARTAPELEEVARQIKADGGRAMAVPADIADEAEVARMVDTVLSEFGTIDILVNNAAVLRWGEVESPSLEQWNRTLAVNLTGMFLCSRAVIQPMKRQRRGHLVNLSSEAGKRGHAKLSAYCASKSGVLGFSEALAEELAPWGIKVSVLVPGPTDTDLTGGVRRDSTAPRLRPSDVARAVLYLVTQPDGGWTQEMNVWPVKHG